MSFATKIKTISINIMYLESEVNFSRSTIPKMSLSTTYLLVYGGLHFHY